MKSTIAAKRPRHKQGHLLCGRCSRDRRWLQADERGSGAAISDASGNAIAINRYDEFGIPQSGNVGRFQYTGQTWFPEVGLYNYKARWYSPTMGRFMQTDPIGYADGLNWYDYVGGDPVNNVDPTGLACTGSRLERNCSNISGLVSIGGYWKPVDPSKIARDPEEIVASTNYRWVSQPEIIGRGGGAGVLTPQREEKRKLPKCLQDFLRGRIASNPADITLHNGSPLELIGNSVTFGNNIYLMERTFEAGRSIRHKFHEIGHTSQYAKGHTSAGIFISYAFFDGHDGSPYEIAADDFADDAYNDFLAAGLDKTCKF